MGQHYLTYYDWRAITYIIEWDETNVTQQILIQVTLQNIEGSLAKVMII